MSVNLKPQAGAQASPPRLPVKPWHSKAQAYQSTQIEQHQLESRARALKAVADALKAELIAISGPVPVAFCGELVLTFSPLAASGASITLADGQKFALGALRGLVLPDGRVVKPEAVASLYGGRAGGTKLDVRG